MTTAARLNAAQLDALREFAHGRIVFCPPGTTSRRVAFANLYRRGIVERVGPSVPVRRDIRDVSRFQLTAEGIIRARRAGVFVLI